MGSYWIWDMALRKDDTWLLLYHYSLFVEEDESHSGISINCGRCWYTWSGGEAFWVMTELYSVCEDDENVTTYGGYESVTTYGGYEMRVTNIYAD